MFQLVRNHFTISVNKCLAASLATQSHLPAAKSTITHP